MIVDEVRVEESIGRSFGPVFIGGTPRFAVTIIPAPGIRTFEAAGMERTVGWSMWPA